MPADVLTVSDDCSTDCKNLKIRFQFPPHRSKSSLWVFNSIWEYVEWEAHSWNAAKSTNDRNLWGYSPWLPPNVLEVNSKHARSMALSRPELKISKIKCDGNSSIETGLYRSAIYIQLSKSISQSTKETQNPIDNPDSKFVFFVEECDSKPLSLTSYCQIFRRNLRQLKQHIKKTLEGRKIQVMEYKNGGFDEKFCGDWYSDWK